MSKHMSLWKILQKIHRDEEGGVSLETILVIALIALPALILIVKFGWPAIQGYFKQEMKEAGIDIPEG